MGGRKIRILLSSDNHFPQMIPRQEELDRVEFLEQLFQTAVVEVLRGFALAAGTVDAPPIIAK